MEEIVKAIKAKYIKVSNELGAFIGATTLVSGTNWWYQKYEKGIIYCNSINKSTFAVYGMIYGNYVVHKLHKGILGYPTTDETGTPDKVGRYNHFENGSIYWTPDTGAHEIHGDIVKKWSGLGWERSVLGYPITDETTAPDKIGKYNHFERGSIYWTPKTGAHEVHGDIRGKWSTIGWERSVLGYPITDETEIADNIGRFNHFENGSIYWTLANGPHVIHGDIMKKWANVFT